VEAPLHNLYKPCTISFFSFYAGESNNGKKSSLALECVCSYFGRTPIMNKLFCWTALITLLLTEREKASNTIHGKDYSKQETKKELGFYSDIETKDTDH